MYDNKKKEKEERNNNSALLCKYKDMYIKSPFYIPYPKGPTTTIPRKITLEKMGKVRVNLYNIPQPLPSLPKNLHVRGRKGRKRRKRKIKTRTSHLPEHLESNIYTNHEK